MRKLRLACALTIAVFGAAAMAQASGKPSTVPVGPPSTPVEKPATPPADPPGSLTDFVCSILAVPFLCD
jgi:hypothetical protein